MNAFALFERWIRYFSHVPLESIACIYICGEIKCFSKSKTLLLTKSRIRGITKATTTFVWNKPIQYASPLSHSGRDWTLRNYAIPIVVSSEAQSSGATRRILTNCNKALSSNASTENDASDLLHKAFIRDHMIFGIIVGRDWCRRMIFLAIYKRCNGVN